MTQPPSLARIPAKLHRNVALVRVEEPILAEELLARRALARLLVGRMDSRTLLVAPESVGLLLEELRRAGHFARVVRSRR
jgi:hypothetical protein